MIPFFKDLFEYSHHFNQKLADVFMENQDKTSEKSVRLFSHILNAHQIWNNRIDPKQPGFGVWELQAVGNFKNIDLENFNHSLLILETFDLDARINYTTSKGQPFGNSIREVLFHIVNHTTYHRGQIATEFRNSGLEPLMTEYIFYKR